MYDIDKRTSSTPPSPAVAYTTLVLGVAGMILCAVLHIWLGVLTTAVTLLVVMALLSIARSRSSVHRPAAQTRIRIALDHGPAVHVQDRADRAEAAARRYRARLLSTRAELEQTRQDKAQLTWQAAAAIGAADALASRPAQVVNNFFGDDVARQALEATRPREQQAIPQRGSDGFGQPDRDWHPTEERRR